MFRKYKFLTKSINEEERKKYIKEIMFFLYLQGKYTWIVIETDSIITQRGAFQIICKKPE